MSTIVTRAGKGSALTWTEGDQNLINLNTDKIENVVEDTTPQLGGDLDVNGKKITSVSNGNIALEPNGTGKITATKNIETTGDVKANELWSTWSSGDEGGQLNLAQAVTNTTLDGDSVTIDIYQNKLRIFEQGGNARGVYIDLTSAASGVGTNLLSGGSSSPEITNDTTTSTAMYPLFAASTSGSLSAVYTGNTKLRYVPSSGTLYATIFSGSLTGNASSATTAETATYAAVSQNYELSSAYVYFGSSASISASLAASISLRYDSSTSTLTSTKFSGALNGTVGATTPAAGTFTTLTVNGANELRLADSDSTNYVGFKAPATVSANNIWILPTADGTSGQVLKTDGADNLSWTSVVTSVGGTGTVAGLSLSGTVTGTGNLTLGGSLDLSSYSGTVSGTGFSTYLASPPAIGGTTAAAGTFTTLTSTGRLVMKDLTETVYSIGTTSGTIAPNVANGTVQKITLNGNLTLNAFTSPVAGQSLTLIVTQDATGNRTLTSTMKFSGGSKTLSTAANAVDIITIFYDGTYYYASLGKDFK